MIFGGAYPRPSAVALALATLAATVGGSTLAAQDLPRVLVIATGGTIAGQAQGGQLTGAQIVEAVPAVGEIARVSVEEFSRIGSSAMTPDHWLRLSARIDEIFRADADLAGIIVTHGTDTMEETGYFLHLTVNHDRPVVMVGSMRTSSAVSADGPANLLSGVRVAVSESSRGRGVLVVLNDEVHSARDVRKTDNNRVNTFRSVEWGALGVVDADRIVYRRSLETLHSTESEVRMAEPAGGLPPVAIVADYAGHDGSALRAAVDAGARGVVVQAFGGGRASPGMRSVIAEVASEGVVVVLASRVAEGRVMSGVASPERNVVAAGDLPPHRARVLLMLALGQGMDGSGVQRLFDTH